jgi:hypothetical protein
MSGKYFTNQEVQVNKKTYDVHSRCTLGGVHWVNYFLLTTSFSPFLLAPFIVSTFFVRPLLSLRGNTTLLLLIPADKSPIAATVRGSVAISEDDCDRFSVRNPTDSKGNSRGIIVVSTAKRLVAAATFVSIDVCDAAGMGGLGRNRLGWALSSIRVKNSGLGCAFACVDSILENGLLRAEKEDVPWSRAILLAVAAILGEVRVGGDDTWVLFDGICNIFFCPTDAFAVARGALLIFLGAIFNFIFGLISALALAFGRGVDFAFGGVFVVFFSFFFADVVVFFTNNFGWIIALALAFGGDVDFAFGGAFFVFFSFFVADVVVVFFNNFGWISAFDLAFGGGVDFAFGGAFIVFFSFFVADVVVVFPNNLKLGGNCIIPSSCNNFKLGRVNFGLPLPCAIIFFYVAFA